MLNLSAKPEDPFCTDPFLGFPREGEGMYPDRRARAGAAAAVHALRAAAAAHAAAAPDAAAAAAAAASGPSPAQKPMQQVSGASVRKGWSGPRNFN